MNGFFLCFSFFFFGMIRLLCGLGSALVGCQGLTNWGANQITGLAHRRVASQFELPGWLAY